MINIDYACLSDTKDTLVHCSASQALHTTQQELQTVIVSVNMKLRASARLSGRAPDQNQGVYKFNQANFQEIPGGISRKIQTMFALLRPPM